MGCGNSTTTHSATEPGPRVKGAAPGEAKRSHNFYDHYRLGSKLGAGAFAQVRLSMPAGSDEDDEANCRRAVKVIDLRTNKTDLPDKRQPTDDAIDQRALWEAKSEHSIWQKATDDGNPYCIRLYEVFWDEACCYMVMERCDSVLLDELQYGDYTEFTLGRIFSQMVAAMSHLHHSNIVHRDIKPDNFMVNNGHRLRLGDFGLSACIRPGDMLKQVYGTAPFMSPEMLKEGRYNEKTDVWSLGVLMYVLLYGNFPYFAQEKTSKAMKGAICEGKAPSYKPWVKPGTPGVSVKPSLACENIVKAMLARDPQARVSAQEALSDDYWAKAEHPSYAAECPSLRHMLAGALRAGAFAAVRRDKDTAKDATDMLLSELSKKSARMRSASSLKSGGTSTTNSVGSHMMGTWTWHGKSKLNQSPSGSFDMSRLSTDLSRLSTSASGTVTGNSSSATLPPSAPLASGIVSPGGATAKGGKQVYMF
mmetsp:Transcript_23328/g.53767  ORF Transcript_23328/g.53767 Transcript_23328/m.53767 type:complete len:477 (+) Transcript_23328:112-1542(+)